MEQKIRKVVRHLRNKSEQERRQILSISMICVCIVMAILWTWSLGENLTKEETYVKVKEDLKPFSVLKSNLIDSWGNTNPNTDPVVE